MFLTALGPTAVELASGHTLTLEAPHHEVEFYCELCRGVNIEKYGKVKLIRIVRDGLNLGLHDAKIFVEEAVRR